MKQCMNCGMSHSDDKMFCANCGSQLQGFPNMNMGMQNQGMGMMNQGMGMQNQGMPIPQMSLSTPPVMNSSKPAPKKKSSKKVVIGIVVALLVLAVAGVAVFFILKGSMPKEEFYADNLPEELLEYEFEGDEYTSELSEVKVIKQEKNDGVVEAECEIVVDDDMMTRTLYYTFTCEKEDGEWEITEYSENEEAFITAKEELAEIIVSDYELENISNFEIISQNEDSTFVFSYDVDDSYSILDLEGTITFDVDVNAYDTDDIDYYYIPQIDETELVAKWDIEGSYYDDTSSQNVIIGTRIDQDDNFASFEFFTDAYGEDTGSAYIDNYSLFSTDGNLQCIAECSGDKAYYYLYFDEAGIVSSRVEGNDGAIVEENMVVGEYTTPSEVQETVESEQPMSQPDENGIVENIPEIPYPEEGAAGQQIYIYSWNDELGTRIDTHFRTRYPELSDLVVYKNLDVSGVSDTYMEKIQSAIDAGGESVPSIFAADIDIARNFMIQDYVVPVSEVGITKDMYANAYDYTVEYATVDGELMALTWQAMPGAVAYRTDIAEEVLGFSDPESVQSALNDWDSFFAVAEMMKSAGYYMVSGPDDIKYAMRTERTSPWVIDGALNIDPAINTYLEYSKKLYDENYTKKTMMWSSDWMANMADDVFCYFGCTWFIPWTLSIEDTDVMGKYNVITGPSAYCWGGSFLMVTEACPNKELAALVLYTLCCDAEAMYDMYDIDMDFCNNKLAVRNLIADGKGSLEKLGGQSPLAIYDASARGVHLDIATQYDYSFNGYADSASDSYNSGDLPTIDDAIAYIKDSIASNYSEIVVE